MPFLKAAIIFLCCVLFVHMSGISDNSHSNFQVKRFKLCNDTQGLYKFEGNITKEGNKWYGTGTVILPIPMDENVGATCTIESKVLKNYAELFIIREKYACKAFNMYFGELWYDIQRAAQAIPGACPLPARRYGVHHMNLDFNRISLQTFPFGDLKFTAALFDRRHPWPTLICLMIEVENIYK